MAIQISGTTVIDNSRNVRNVIGVGNTGTTTFFGDGSKLTGISLDGTNFNTSITNSFTASLSGIGQTVLTLPSTAGKEYVIYSIHAANVGLNTEVNVIGAFNFVAGGKSYFSYNIPIPEGTSVELLNQSQVLNPSDKIEMRATDYERVGATNSVDVYITYEEKTSTDYFGFGVSPTTTDTVGIYTSTGNPSIIESIRLTNKSDLGPFPITISILRGGTTRTLARDLIVPKYASIELIETPKRLETNNVLQVKVEQPSIIDIQVSGKVVTQ